MKKIKLCSLYLLLLFLTLTQTGCLLHSTGSTEIGVKTRKFGIFGPQGVEQNIYSPGSTYFFLPIINDWNTFDTKLQNIEMTLTETKGDVLGQDDLRFKTIDGNDISLDVIISYRIIPQKAPYILEFIARNDFELRTKIVRGLARSLPRDIFGELTTEDFYTAEKRAQKSEKAKETLNKILNKYGVVVEQILTKDYRFNPAYQQAIEDKKIADQKTEQNKSATKAKQEEYLRRLEEAKGEVSEIVAVADGEFEQAKIEANAYYSQQSQLAKAIKAEGIAEAEGISRMNNALAQQGGKVMVKLKMAEALKGKKIIILPTSAESGMNLNTLDMNRVLQMYGIDKVKTQQKKAISPATKNE